MAKDTGIKMAWRCGRAMATVTPVRRADGGWAWRPMAEKIRADSQSFMTIMLKPGIEMRYEAARKLARSWARELDQATGS